MSGVSKKTPILGRGFLPSVGYFLVIPMTAPAAAYWHVTAMMAVKAVPATSHVVAASMAAVIRELIHLHCLIGEGCRSVRFSHCPRNWEHA
jgi:hypothetical protein